MSRVRSVGLSLALALTLAGCTANPSVELLPMQPDLVGHGAIPFRLTDSVIALGAPADSAPTDAKGLKPPVSLARHYVVCGFGVDGRAPPLCQFDIVPFVAPVDFAGAVFAVQPQSRTFVETRLAATYLPDSLRLAELAVAVKDHRVEVINAIGTLAAAAAGAMEPLPQRAGQPDDDRTDTTTPPAPRPIEATLVLPVIIDADDRRDAQETGQCLAAAVPRGAGPCHSLPRNPGWSYRLSWADDPGAQGLLPRSRLPGLRNAMVASACRPARLELYASLSNGLLARVMTLRLSLADPDWLIAMPLPPKGQLAFHPLCGMDMKREDAAEIGADAMATALYNQVRTLRASNN